MTGLKQIALSTTELCDSLDTYRSNQCYHDKDDRLIIVIL